MNFHERREAYASYCRQVLKKEPRILITGYSIPEISQVITQYLDIAQTPPTAIFAESFQASLGTIKAMQDRGMRIPEDMSVAGFDELPESTLLSFHLASVRALHKESACVAAKRLLERIEGKSKASLEIYVRTEFLPGSSVAPFKHQPN